MLEGYLCFAVIYLFLMGGFASTILKISPKDSIYKVLLDWFINCFIVVISPFIFLAGYLSYLNRQIKNKKTHE